MGEVWRARDTRLGREVAVKVLPQDVATDPNALARFAREARAVAALSHPNILALFDVGESGGIHFAVTELLQGQTLRLALAAGPLPVRRALDVAVQIAEALAAAHENGIVHRDVKPENVFLGPDGHVKLLDFGLARPTSPRDAGDTRSPTVTSLSAPGCAAGTVAYMSPEQARGVPVDHRSDQFSLGIVLYEMLAGLRPFRGDSAAETMAAIIREEPEPLDKAAPGVPGPVRWSVERCLAKDSAERYDSTRDLARDLATFRLHLSDASLPAAAPGPTAARAPAGRCAALAAAGLLVAAVLVGGGALLGPKMGRNGKAPDIAIRRLTFKRGWVSEARFAEQGKSVVYSATLGGAPTELFSIRLPGTDSVPLGITKADLLAVSPSGDLALRRNTLSPFHWWGAFQQSRVSPTLATVPLAGGTPKDEAEGIYKADYAPDGKTMAVARLGDKGGIEYPLGSEPKKAFVVPGFDGSGFRISRDGKLVAFHDAVSQGSGSLKVLRPDGEQRPLTEYDAPPLGLAWSPKGDEVWYAERNKLRAVTLSGRVRDLYAHTTPLKLHDVAPDGRVLVTAEELRQRIFFCGERDAAERELGLLDKSIVCDLSPDGKLVTFFEQTGGSEGVPVSYLRETSGAPPMKIGEGAGPRLSPDGRFVVVTVYKGEAREIVVHPVGPGPARTVRVPGYFIRWAGLLSDGQGIWFAGAEEATKRWGFWVTDLAGSKPRAVTPEGVGGNFWCVTPDARYGVATWKGGWWLFPLSGGEPRLLPGVQPNEMIAGFGPDLRTVYVAKRFEIPLKPFRVDLRTGKREPVREIVPPDRSGIGINGTVTVRMSADGRSYLSGIDQQLSDLYLVEGLR